MTRAPIVARIARCRSLAAWLAALFLSGFGMGVPAGAQVAPQDAHGAGAVSAGCAACHTCDTPSPENPCLRQCRRDETQRIAEAFESKQGPRLVILDELEDRYLPVPFDHQGHAAMAGMTRGCAVCHHYTPEGLQHPACKTCHEVAPLTDDIHKPGLKGAYHRQCMSCHREWSGEARCGACHLPKTGRATRGEKKIAPTKDDLIGRMHPPIPEPEVEVYETKWEGYSPSKVTFRHKAHIHEYGLRCAECHREDGCARCHEEGRQHVQRVRGLDDHHKPCLDCHRNVTCSRCHYEENAQPPAAFDHAATGWPLKPYHQKAGCRACHVAVPFVRLDRSCASCHQGFDPSRFDHAVTGQLLSEEHASVDCETCHPQRAYQQPPVCTDCHEPADGVSFPAKRPGPVASVEPPQEP